MKLTCFIALHSEELIKTLLDCSDSYYPSCVYSKWSFGSKACFKRTRRAAAVLSAGSTVARL